MARFSGYFIHMLNSHPNKTGLAPQRSWTLQRWPRLPKGQTWIQGSAPPRGLCTLMIVSVPYSVRTSTAMALL